MLERWLPWTRNRKTANAMKRNGKPIGAKHSFRPALEGFEDRLVPTAIPATVGFESVSPAVPASAGAGYQYLKSGTFQTVSRVEVENNKVDFGTDYGMDFQAAFRLNKGASDIVWARYLIDGQLDPLDGGLIDVMHADSVATVKNDDFGAWGTISITRQIHIAGAGSHTITVELMNQNGGLSNGHDVVVWSPVLHLTKPNIIDKSTLTTATFGYQSIWPENPYTSGAGYQYVKAGSYQTVSHVYVANNDSALTTYDMNFQAVVRSNATSDHVWARYLIDGKADPFDSGFREVIGADSVIALPDSSYGAWGTITLSRQLNIWTPGEHTITVEIKCDNSSFANGHDLVVWSPVLRLTRTNMLGGKASIPSSVGFETVSPDRPETAGAGYQYVKAGTYQTVNAVPVVTNDLGGTMYDMDFQAVVRTNAVRNGVWARYLIDGQPDPFDGGFRDVMGADSVITLDENAGWGTIRFSRQINIWSLGNHTITVEIKCDVGGTSTGHDLVVWSPVLHLTKPNIVDDSKRPTPLMPVDQIQLNSPKFSWSALANTDRYDLWVDDLTSGKSQVIRETKIQETTWYTPALSPGHTYKWWIRAIDTMGNASEWSEGLSFRIAPLGVPTANRATGASTTDTPALSWSPVQDAARYDLWVDDATWGVGQVVRQKQLTDSTFVAPPLSPGHTYVWWVRAVSEDGTGGSWSAAQTFKVAPLAAPVTNGPVGILSGDTCTFAWSEAQGAVRYDLWVDDATWGIAQVIRKTQLTGTEWSSSALSPGHTYQYWLRAISANGTGGAWSSMQTFSVPPLAKPTLLAPGSSIASTTPTFSWNAVAMADHYEFWLSDLSTGASPSLQKLNLSDTPFTPQTSEKLMVGHQYRWWIRAVSQDATKSVWSEAMDFRIASI